VAPSGSFAGLGGPTKLNDISQESCDPALILTARLKQKAALHH
jgi:hypothetical protein